MSASSGRGMGIAVAATVLLWLAAGAGAVAFWLMLQSPAETQPLGPAPLQLVEAMPVIPVTPSAPVPASVPPAGGLLSHVALTPAQGDLETQLRAQMLASERSGRRLLVFFTATWCLPCQAVKRTLALPDVAARLTDVQLVEVDVDAFRGAQMTRAGEQLLDQEVDAIPLVCALRSRRPPVCMDGGAWGEDSDANIRTVLVPFMVEPPSGIAPRASDRITPI